MQRLSLIPIAFVFLVVPTVSVAAPSGADVQRRMSSDAASGKALVAHVVVALCDNQYQGIVPVPEHLGDGDNPASNLYWGALYGVKTYFSRMDTWQRTEVSGPQHEHVLDRVAFHRTVEREGRSVEVVLIAEAWRGREIEAATARFLALAGGEHRERYVLPELQSHSAVEAGGAAHLVTFVGHNGLMDFAAPAVRAPVDLSPRSSIVLACASRSYFSDLLGSKRSHSLLTTNGLMAPEAYTLEAAVTEWFSGASAEVTRDAAAATYAEFQKANLRWARSLFASDE